MDTFLYYLLKVVICSAMFAACYWLLLRNSRLHYWNRFYILTAVILSVVIPLIEIPLVVNELSNVPLYVSQLIVEPSAEITVNGAMEEHTSFFTWKWMLYMFCLLGCLLLIVKEIRSLVYMIRLKHLAEKISVHGVDVYYTDDEQAPFTFFRTIFWNKRISPYTEEGRCVLAHEQTHVRLFHTWDKLFIRLVCCIFWMNPFFRFFCRELELVHEFAADSETIGNGNEKALSSLILCTLYPNHYHDFTSRFFQSPIKRRIVMITHQKKISAGMIRKLSIIPVVLIALYFFSVKIMASVPGNENSIIQQQDPLTPQNGQKRLKDPAALLNDLKQQKIIVVAFGKGEKRPSDGTSSFSIKEPKSGVFTYSEVDVKPTYNGKATDDGFREYISRNLAYPPAVIEARQAGTVLVSFIVDAAGKVTDVAAEVDTKNDILGKEVERAVKASSLWTPGKKDGKNVPVQLYTFVEFRYQNGDQVGSAPKSTGDDVYTFAMVDQKPLFDNKPVEESFRDYITKNTVYPPDAMKRNIQGRVYVEFLIDKTGNVKNAKVVRGVDPLLDKEALRVISSSSQWTPGKHNGEAVDIQYTFPITFKLQGDKKPSASETSDQQS